MIERSENMLSPERVSTKTATSGVRLPTRAQVTFNTKRKMTNINPNYESSQSQCKAILAHLREGKTITAIEALRLFGCFRLTSRIHDLTKRGVAISRKYITTDTGKRVMQYSLAQN